MQCRVVEVYTSRPGSTLSLVLLHQIAEGAAKVVSQPASPVTES